MEAILQITERGIELAIVLIDMKKKIPLFLILTGLICYFLSSCQIVPNFLDAVQTFPQEEMPSPTIIIESTATSSVWTATLPINITTQVQATATALPPTSAPTPTPMLISSFITQEDMPVYMTNFAHPSAGCNWMGVAGQVFDTEGREIQNLTLILGNMLTVEEQVSAARTSLAPAYGPGGYEIQIAEKTFDSTNSIWVQVLDSGGNALSEKFFFDTFNDCSRNLILINFIPKIGVHEPAQQNTPDLEQDADAYP